MAALPLAAQTGLTQTATLRIEVDAPPSKEHPKVPVVFPVTFWYQIEGGSGQKIEALSGVTKDIQIPVSERGSEIAWTAHAPDLPPSGKTAIRWSKGGKLRLSSKRVGEVTLKVDAEDLASFAFLDVRFPPGVRGEAESLSTMWTDRGWVSSTNRTQHPWRFRLSDGGVLRVPSTSYRIFATREANGVKRTRDTGLLAATFGGRPYVFKPEEFMRPPAARVQLTDSWSHNIWYAWRPHLGPILTGTLLITGIDSGRQEFSPDVIPAVGGTLTLKTTVRSAEFQLGEYRINPDEEKLITLDPREFGCGKLIVATDFPRPNLRLFEAGKEYPAKIVPAATPAARIGQYESEVWVPYGAHDLELEFKHADVTGRQRIEVPRSGQQLRRVEFRADDFTYGRVEFRVSGGGTDQVYLSKDDNGERFYADQFDRVRRGTYRVIGTAVGGTPIELINSFRVDAKVERETPNVLTFDTWRLSSVQLQVDLPRAAAKGAWSLWRRRSEGKEFEPVRSVDWVDSRFLRLAPGAWTLALRNLSGERSLEKQIQLTFGSQPEPVRFTDEELGVARLWIVTSSAMKDSVKIQVLPGMSDWEPVEGLETTPAMLLAAPQRRLVRLREGEHTIQAGELRVKFMIEGATERAVILLPPGEVREQVERRYNNSLVRTVVDRPQPVVPPVPWVDVADQPAVRLPVVKPRQSFSVTVDGIVYRMQWVERGWLATTMLTEPNGVPRRGLTMAQMEQILKKAEKSVEGCTFDLPEIEMWEKAAMESGARPLRAIQNRGLPERYATNSEKFLHLYQVLWQPVKKEGGSKLAGGSIHTDFSKGERANWESSVPKDFEWRGYNHIGLRLAAYPLDNNGGGER